VNSENISQTTREEERGKTSTKLLAQENCAIGRREQDVLFMAELKLGPPKRQYAGCGECGSEFSLRAEAKER
jgi:hypothetical protein